MSLSLRHVAILTVGLLSLCLSAPIIRYAAAPAVWVVFWRLVFTLPVVGGVALWRHEPWPRRSALLAGLFLAMHWMLWVAAVQRTTVAIATVLVCSGAVWSPVLSGPLLREPVSRRQWLGACIALAGVAVMVVSSITGSHEAHRLDGDLLALSAAFAWVGYAFVGRRARQIAGFWGYTSAVYGVALAVTALTLVATEPLPSWLGTTTGLPATAWGALVALALLPTLLGHGSMNYLLRFVGPAQLSLWTLTEPLGAALLAWPLFGEVPSATEAMGAIATLLGVALGSVNLTSTGALPEPTTPVVVLE